MGYESAGFTGGWGEGGIIVLWLSTEYSGMTLYTMKYVCQHCDKTCCAHPWDSPRLITCMAEGYHKVTVQCRTVLRNGSSKLADLIGEEDSILLRMVLH
jgi:hypothetical protein